MSTPTEEEHEHGKPSDGMMCLVTMEDITEEDQNYGTYALQLVHVHRCNLTTFLSVLVAAHPSRIPIIPIDEMEACSI